MRTNRAWIVFVCLVLTWSLPALGQHFYFAQMTDIHFGYQDGAERAAKAVDSINRLPMKIECVVVTGDVIDTGALDMAAVKTGTETMAKLKPPVHYVPGNHDIPEGDKAVASEEAFARNFGPHASKAEYDGVVFLMVWTEPLKMKVSVPDYDPIAWLAQAVKDAGDKPVIVCTHSADVEDLNAGFAADGGQLFHEWPKESREKWDAIIKPPNVKAVIAGHFHRDQLHWIGCTPVYVCPPVTGMFGRQITYRVYEYTDGRLGYWTVYLR